MLALPIFPASHPASIVGANELNFCVRDGNRWTLTAINTNCCRSKSSTFLHLARYVSPWRFGIPLTPQRQGHTLKTEHEWIGIL